MSWQSSAEQDDRYVQLTGFVGGLIKYVQLRPPVDVAKKAVNAGDWTLDLDDLEQAISPRTKMLV